MESYKNKEWMEEQYITLRKSCVEIGKDLGRGKVTINRWLHKLGIPVRRRGLRKDMFKGQNNCHWKGGVKMKRNKWILIYKPDHPSARKDGYIAEHRFIMEQHLGRHLNKDEIVHHIDGDVLNNYIENLEIMTNGEHTKLHWKHQNYSSNGVKN